MGQFTGQPGLHKKTRLKKLNQTKRPPPKKRQEVGSTGPREGLKTILLSTSHEEPVILSLVTTQLVLLTQLMLLNLPLETQI